MTVAVVSLPGGSAATRVQVFPSQPRRPCQCQPCSVLDPGDVDSWRVRSTGGLSRLGAGCRSSQFLRFICVRVVLQPSFPVILIANRTSWKREVCFALGSPFPIDTPSCISALKKPPFGRSRHLGSNFFNNQQNWADRGNVRRPPDSTFSTRMHVCILERRRKVAPGHRRM